MGVRLDTRTLRRRGRRERSAQDWPIGVRAVCRNFGESLSCDFRMPWKRERDRPVRRIIDKLVAFLRWLLASETLPTDVGAADASRDASARSPGFSRWLVQGDKLNAAALGPRTKPVRFVRWVLSPDELSPVVTDPSETQGRPPRFWRWLVRGEEVPPSDAEDRGSPLRTMFFRRLLASEACPVAPDEPVRRPAGFLWGLLQAEQCPRHPVETPREKQGFVRWVMEGEPCPVDSSPAPARRRGFWRKLFTPEKL